MEDILIGNVLMAIKDPGNNAFANVATAGEMLRQAVFAADRPSAKAEKALRLYDDWIRTWKGPVPTGLDRLLEQSLDELRKIANRKDGYHPTFEDGEQVFTDIDAILSVAAALWRAGKMPEHEVRQLAKRAADVVQELLPYLSQWWQWADEIWPLPVGDPDLPFLTDWRWILGRYAPDRIEMEMAACRAGMRERLRRMAFRRLAGNTTTGRSRK